jgi:hypothetical protein
MVSRPAAGREFGAGSISIDLPLVSCERVYQSAPRASPSADVCTTDRRARCEVGPSLPSGRSMGGRTAYDHLPSHCQPGGIPRPPGQALTVPSSHSPAHDLRPEGSPGAAGLPLSRRLPGPHERSRHPSRNEVPSAPPRSLRASMRISHAQTQGTKEPVRQRLR